MGDRLFLHEHVAGARTAQVFHDLGTNKYWVQCYMNSTLYVNELFLTEHDAENYAEDWVLQPE